MKTIKEFIKSPLGLLITTSWIALILCLIIKLFGGNWFELWLDNDKFISFCNFVDNTKWLKMVLACGIYLITTIPAMCVFLNIEKFTRKLYLLFIPLMICKSICGWYFVYISYLLDVLILILLPMILNKFKNWKRVIIGNILVMVFQLLTLAVRNLNVGFGFNVNNTFIIQCLYQVDYYLMIILFYLYNTKKLKKGDK